MFIDENKYIFCNICEMESRMHKAKSVKVAIQQHFSIFLYFSNNPKKYQKEIL